MSTRLKQLAEKCNGPVTVTIDPHIVEGQTVLRYLVCLGLVKLNKVRLDPMDVKRMMDTNTIVKLTVIYNRSLSLTYHAPTVETCMEKIEPVIDAMILRTKEKWG